MSKPANWSSAVQKAGKIGSLNATNGSADALKDWLVVRGGESGPLFCNINKGGKIKIHRMTATRPC